MNSPILKVGWTYTWSGTYVCVRMEGETSTLFPLGEPGFPYIATLYPPKMPAAYYDKCNADWAFEALRRFEEQ